MHNNLPAIRPSSRHISLESLTFADNPQPRCPVSLLLDCSTSMVGEPIRLLQEAVSQFYTEVAGDPVASLSVELSIATFGDGVRQVRPFEPIETALERRAICLTASGNTPMGEALTLGMHVLGERRAFYKKQGIAAYKPWMILLTDGQPNDEWVGPSQRAKALASEGRLLFIGVGVGDCVDWPTLAEILPKNQPPLILHNLRFKEFFRWVTDSLRLSVSASTQQSVDLADPEDYNMSLYGI